MGRRRIRIRWSEAEVSDKTFVQAFIMPIAVPVPKK